MRDLLCDHAPRQRGVLTRRRAQPEHGGPSHQAITPRGRRRNQRSDIIRTPYETRPANHAIMRWSPTPIPLPLRPPIPTWRTHADMALVTLAAAAQMLPLPPPAPRYYGARGARGGGDVQR